MLRSAGFMALLPFSLLGGCSAAPTTADPPELGNPGVSMEFSMDQPPVVYASLADLPPEFDPPPSINRWRATAGFESGHAWGQGIMDYWGNRAEQSVRLSLRYGHSLVGTTPGIPERNSFWFPRDRTMLSSASMLAGGNCGYIVDSATSHLAYNSAPLTSGWVSWGHTARNDYASAAQPSCGCQGGSGSTFLRNPSYDPYDQTGGGGCTGSGGNSAGSGGDCVREFIIIEVYNVDTGAWEIWWQGSAIVCTSTDA